MTASRHDVSGPRPSCVRARDSPRSPPRSHARCCVRILSVMIIIVYTYGDDGHHVIYVLLITPIAIETKTFITSSSPMAKEIQAHDEASLVQKLCHSRRHASFHHDDPSHTGHGSHVPAAGHRDDPQLIYFDVKTKKQVLENIRQLLPPDGYMFLGAAETTINIHAAFQQCRFNRAGCYALASSQRLAS